MNRNNNNSSRQQGVALIQVLLITFMLLILMIQLNKEARLEVQLAIKLKSKLSLEAQTTSALERVKFALLTEDRNKVNSDILESNWNFYGDPILVQQNISVMLQDEAGKISLPYAGEELVTWLGDPALYRRLRSYQGVDVMTRNTQGNGRMGYMQSLEELAFVPGWQTRDNLNALTHLPTEYFNLFNGPRSLFQDIFTEDIVTNIEQLRYAGNQNLNDWQAVTGRNIAYSVSREPGTKIMITMRASTDNMTLTRSERFWIDPLNHDLVLRIMK